MLPDWLLDSGPPVVAWVDGDQWTVTAVVCDGPDRALALCRQAARAAAARIDEYHVVVEAGDGVLLVEHGTRGSPVASRFLVNADGTPTDDEPWTVPAATDPAPDPFALAWSPPEPDRYDAEAEQVIHVVNADLRRTRRLSKLLAAKVRWYASHLAVSQLVRLDDRGQERSDQATESVEHAVTSAGGTVCWWTED